MGEEDFDEKEDENYAAQDPNENDQENRAMYEEDKIYEKIFSGLTELQIETVMELKNNTNLY